MNFSTLCIWSCKLAIALLPLANGMLVLGQSLPLEHSRFGPVVYPSSESPVFLARDPVVTETVGGSQRRPLESSSSVTDELLAQGLDFERRRVWNEAINLYETALRSDPNQPQVRKRLQIARLHQDVIRRCADSAIEHLTRTVSPTEALDLYSEILARLEISYVDAIQFTELVRGGTAYLEVALTESPFINAQVSPSARDRVEKFRTGIHRLTLARTIHSRNEARHVVARAAELAHSELGVHPTVTVFQFTFGAIALLDPYSAFLSPAELTEIESQIEGSFVGLGVALEPHVVPLRILNVIPGGPAREAGLQANDRILEIGSVRCSDVGAERAADLLRGPEGSQVRLVLQQPDGQIVDRIVTRRRVEVPSVEDSQLLDDESKVAYLKITSFQKTTAHEVDEALWSLHHQGMQSLIIDLRGNPGGWLDASVAVADRFIAEGAIVSTRGKNGIENQNYVAHRSGTWQMPLYLLVDDQSASASEILAGAIRDNNRGKLIGCTTYGKGSVQGLFHTKSLGCGVRLTVSKFYSPSGRAISELGVQPNLAVDKEINNRFVSKPVIDRPNPIQDRVLQMAIDEAKSSGFSGLVSSRSR